MSIVHTIDCDARPREPPHLSLMQHRRGGHVAFDPSTLLLYCDPGQRGSKTIQGTLLRTRLDSVPVMNASLLDFLLDHQQLIPERWKRDPRGKAGMRLVFFWGTIYIHDAGWPTVRFLYWHDGLWREGNRHLNGLWYKNNPAVLDATQL